MFARGNKIVVCGIRTGDNDLNVQKSAKNIPGTKVSLVNTINVYDLVKYSKLILTKQAVEKIEEVCDNGYLKISCRETE